MNTRNTAALIAVTALLAVGCAKPPTADIDAARAALDIATTSDAEEYAATEWNEAKGTLQLLDDELALQESKFALMRKYETATQLATQAASQAQAAAAAADAEKQLVRDETTELIAATQAELAVVRDLLANAPRGKGSEADLAMMNADLQQAEGSLVGVETALSEGRLYEARTGARAALEAVGEVKLAIEQAQAARSGRS